MQKITDLSIKAGTRVIIRCDLDVPLKNGQIQEYYRLESAVATLNYLQKSQAKITIIGHMGRPKGQINPELSTTHLKEFFDEQLGKDKYTLRENLRFDIREEENNLEFAKELSQNQDIYINESFATCHQKHASIVTLPTLLPSYAGIRLNQEITILKELIKNPQRPFVVIIGGAKIETKKPAIKKFLEIADTILVGGKTALEWTEVVPDKVILPKDFAKDKKDLGEKTIKEFQEIIKNAKTVLWSGPVGAFEESPYDTGTREIAQSIIESKAYSVIGGGDTITAINKLSDLKKFHFVSTGGSAMLEFIATQTLPGIEVL